MLFQKYDNVHMLYCIVLKIYINMVEKLLLYTYKAPRSYTCACPGVQELEHSAAKAELDFPNCNPRQCRCTPNQCRSVCFACRRKKKPGKVPRQYCFAPAFLCSKVQPLAHWSRAKHQSLLILNYSSCHSLDEFEHKQ